MRIARVDTSADRRHYPEWLLLWRVDGLVYYQVPNLAHPEFWRNLLAMHRPRRAWALCWYLRHLVFRLDALSKHPFQTGRASDRYIETA